jgi:hypothetical protein
VDGRATVREMVPVVTTERSAPGFAASTDLPPTAESGAETAEPAAPEEDCATFAEHPPSASATARAPIARRLRFMLRI